MINKNFRIIYQNEDFPKTRFFDLGAILYFLNAIPWQIEGFSIKIYEPKLKKIQEIIENKGFIEFTEHRFIVIANQL